MKRHGSMNRVFRLVWSEVRGAYIPVAEITKRQGKRCGSGVAVTVSLAGILLAASAQAQPPAVDALPVGAQVVAGTAVINQTLNTLTINQSTQRLITQWSNFDIGQNATVRFNQPNASSIALNRVLSADPTRIMGNLSANGQVWLINPNGVMFGGTARVDVNGLVASALDIRNSDFLASKYSFDRNLNPAGVAGSITQDGRIQTGTGGYIAFIAPTIDNNGVLSAPQGTVALAAADSVSLSFGGDRLIGFTLDRGSIGAMVSNRQLIQADDGVVLLSAKAADQMTRAVVNVSGVIEARAIQNTAGGRIVLDSGSFGTTTVSGQARLDVSGGAGQQGGRIAVLGDQVALLDNAQLLATGDAGGGQVLAGGDWQGKNALIPSSTAVYIGRNALLDASATGYGNGGTIVAWSDVSNNLSTTRVYGTLRAQGGIKGGNGGRIETSGHWLDVAGIRVNANATYGTAGNWLLDPLNINVVATGFDASTLTGGNGVDLFATAGVTAGTSNLDVALLNGAGANVTLQAGNNITFATAVNIAGAGVGLSAQAGNNILLNSGITTNGGAITLAANDAASGVATGTGSISGAGALVSGAGAITLSAATMTLPTITTSGALLTTTTGVGALGTTSFGLTSAGSLSVISGGAVTQTGALSVSGTSNLTATGNAITLDLANALSGTVTAAGTGITLNNGAANLAAILTDAGASDLTTLGSLSVSGSSGAGLTTHAVATSFGAHSVTGNLLSVATGAVTQTGALSVSGTTNLTATGNAITLGLANALTGTVTAAGTGITLNNGSANLAAILTDAGASDLTTLGSLAVSGSSAGLTTHAAATSFGAHNVTGNLLSVATGAVTQTGALSVSGTTNLTATGNAITLSNASNALAGTVTAAGTGITLNNGAANLAAIL
ncbi:MAG TPA: hypothetical protein DE312_07610, partial [Gallionella sp.]|nr:hypothetical protein [Gallionella sp.]